MITTGNVNQTGAFDDADQLGKVLQDERAADTVTMSSVDVLDNYYGAVTRFFRPNAISRVDLRV